MLNLKCLIHFVGNSLTNLLLLTGVLWLGEIQSVLIHFLIICKQFKLPSLFTKFTSDIKGAPHVILDVPPSSNAEPIWSPSVDCLICLAFEHLRFEKRKKHKFSGQKKKVHKHKLWAKKSTNSSTTLWRLKILVVLFFSSFSREIKNTCGSLAPQKYHRASNVINSNDVNYFLLKNRHLTHVGSWFTPSSTGGTLSYRGWSVWGICFTKKHQRLEDNDT